MGQGAPDAHDKAVSLAGLLFEMAGEKDGRKKAEDLISSGKALQKMRQIIEAQGGNPNIMPEQIPIGPECVVVQSEERGRVLWINTDGIVQIARAAGTPKEKGAGIVLKAKIGDSVAKGAPLFEIYAERSSKLTTALEIANRVQPVVLSRKPEEKMLLDQFPAKAPTEQKAFSLDR
jgi:AMP phosphorylase